jgi:hypothetical protein
MPAEPLLCPQCLAQVHPDWPFCTHCGSRLKLEPAPVQSPTSEPSIPVCSNCGAAVDTSGAFCWKCGVPLSTGREPFIPANLEPGTEADDVSVEEAEPRSFKEHRRKSKKRRNQGPTSARSVAAGIVLFVGVVLLVSSLLIGWYSVTARATGSEQGTTAYVNGTEVYYPLNQYSLQLTCAGSSYCPQNETETSSYSQGTFDSIGTLYDIVAAFVIGGFALGFCAGVIAIASRRLGSRLVLGLALIAIILAVLAPTILMVAQPSVLSSQRGSSSGSGDWSSFFGSCSGSNCGQSLVQGVGLNATWGPSLGWYLALSATAPLIAGLFLGRTPRAKSASESVYEFSE